MGGVLTFGTALNFWDRQYRNSKVNNPPVLPLCPFLADVVKQLQTFFSVVLVKLLCKTKTTNDLL